MHIIDDPQDLPAVIMPGWSWVRIQLVAYALKKQGEHSSVVDHFGDRVPSLVWLNQCWLAWKVILSTNEAMWYLIARLAKFFFKVASSNQTGPPTRNIFVDDFPTKRSMDFVDFPACHVSKTLHIQKPVGQRTRQSGRCLRGEVAQLMPQMRTKHFGIEKVENRYGTDIYRWVRFMFFHAKKTMFWCFFAHVAPSTFESLHKMDLLFQNVSDGSRAKRARICAKHQIALVLHWSNSMQVLSARHVALLPIWTADIWRYLNLRVWVFHDEEHKGLFVFCLLTVCSPLDVNVQHDTFQWTQREAKRWRWLDSLAHDGCWTRWIL